MRFLSIACLAFMLAACGAAQKAAPPKPVVIQVPEKAVAFTLPSGWQNEGPGDSIVLQMSCDIRLTSAALKGELCAMIMDDEADPFMDLAPDIQQMIQQKLVDDGWTDVTLTVDAARKMFAIRATKMIALTEGSPEAPLRLHQLRAAVPGDASRAVLVMAYGDAAQAPAVDAAVDAFAAGITVTPAQK